LPAVVHDIPGVNDYVGDRIKTIYRRNRAFEIRYSLISVGRIKLYMGVGNLHNDHDAERTYYRRPA
jgi:hypothetical protein